MEGTPLGSLFNVPAILIIFGGLLGATMASVGMDGMKLIPTLYKKVMSAEPPDLRGQVDDLVSYAERARSDGLLALEEELDGDRGRLHAQGPAARRRRHRRPSSSARSSRPRSTA